MNHHLQKYLPFHQSCSHSLFKFAQSHHSKVSIINTGGLKTSYIMYIHIHFIRPISKGISV